MDTPPRSDPSWALAAAPLLAFLRSRPEGATHAEVDAWRHSQKGLGAFLLTQVLAWLEGEGLARTEGERTGPEDKGKQTRAHLVRWFAGPGTERQLSVPAPTPRKKAAMGASAKDEACY